MRCSRGSKGHLAGGDRTEDCEVLWTPDPPAGRSTMTFSDECLRRCWHLAQGCCECQREGHGHDGRCRAKLVWEYQGRVAPGGWYVCPWTPTEEGGRAEAENAEMLCWSCYAAVMAER